MRQVTLRAVLAVCLVCGCSREPAVAPPSVASVPFDATQWQLATAEIKIGMAHELVREAVLLGQSKADVTALLGDTHSPWGDGGIKWFLGKRKSGGSLMFPYEEYLVLELDDNGVVTNATVMNLE